ncbi:MAG: D-alanyl-D-alanine carboxypeptidase family protein, partial [Acidimicrobiia bacterium]
TRDSVFLDPAGFDDASSFRGGSRVSALDLAIVARNVLAVPELAAAVASLEHSFVDPAGRPHRLLNHNKLLRRYPGAVGLKTGYTRRAGHTLVAGARRDGRTLIAVVLSSPNPYAAATTLLDRGFASPRGADTGERLPPVRVRLARLAAPVVPAVPAPVESVSSPSDRAVRPAAGAPPGDRSDLPVSRGRSDLPLLLLLASAAAVFLRRRAVLIGRYRRRTGTPLPLVGPEAWLLEQDASRVSPPGHIGAS